MIAALAAALPQEEVAKLLPRSFASLRKAISINALLAMIDAFGGTRILVPMHPDGARKLAKVIGLEDLRRLSKLAGGCRIEVPLGAKLRAALRDRALADMGTRGASIRELALRFGMTERAVQRRRRAVTDVKRGRAANKGSLMR